MSASLLRAVALLTAALFAAGMLAAASSVGAYAQCVDRPIMVIVPSSAGEPADVSIRLINDRLSRTLGQCLVTESVPGTGGTIGIRIE